MLATTAIPDNFLPIQQELLDCLRFALEKVENGLRRQGFPPHVAQEATDAAENAALVVI
jgi:L-lactate utilization protein LutB